MSAERSNALKSTDPAGFTAASVIALLANYGVFDDVSGHQAMLWVGLLGAVVTSARFLWERYEEKGRIAFSDVGDALQESDLDKRIEEFREGRESRETSGEVDTEAQNLDDEGDD